ncbi:hypothetical protein [Arthrobacter pityocampae]|uniref:hypothetical protein n=1 Tax=Arthrobacter pityocampae TaxID=547334 RepID=UPI003734E45C
MSAAPVIDARNISKSYGKGDGRFDALRNVTLRIGQGECVAIVGKSGPPSSSGPPSTVPSRRARWQRSRG